MSDAPGAFLNRFHLPIVRSVNELPKNNNVALILALDSDQDAVESIQYIHQHKNIAYFPIHRAFPTANYFRQNNMARRTLNACFESAIEKYDLIDCENIIQALEETRDLPGHYVEIGVYKGSSARAALTYIEASGLQRTSYLLDTFSGFDYQEAQSSADLSWVNTHTDAGYEQVAKTLSACKAPHVLIKSNIIADELPAVIDRICVCNIDVDMYEATMAALVKAAPRIVRGGIMICEDIGHSPLTIGAVVAYKEFLKTEMGRNFRGIYLKSGQAFMVKFSD